MAKFRLSTFLVILLVCAPAFISAFDEDGDQDSIIPEFFVRAYTTGSSDVSIVKNLSDGEALIFTDYRGLLVSRISLANGTVQTAKMLSIKEEVQYLSAVSNVQANSVAFSLAGTHNITTKVGVMTSSLHISYLVEIPGDLTCTSLIMDDKDNLYAFCENTVYTFPTSDATGDISLQTLSIKGEYIRISSAVMTGDKTFKVVGSVYTSDPASNPPTSSYIADLDLSDSKDIKFTSFYSFDISVAIFKNIVATPSGYAVSGSQLNSSLLTNATPFMGQVMGNTLTVFATEETTHVFEVQDSGFLAVSPSTIALWSDDDTSAPTWSHGIASNLVFDFGMQSVDILSTGEIVVYGSLTTSNALVISSEMNQAVMLGSDGTLPHNTPEDAFFSTNLGTSPTKTVVSLPASAIPKVTFDSGSSAGKQITLSLLNHSILTYDANDPIPTFLDKVGASAGTAGSGTTTTITLDSKSVTVPSGGYKTLYEYSTDVTSEGSGKFSVDMATPNVVDYIFSVVVPTTSIFVVENLYLVESLSSASESFNLVALSGIQTGTPPDFSFGLDLFGNIHYTQVWGSSVYSGLLYPDGTPMWSFGYTVSSSATTTVYPYFPYSMVVLNANTLTWINKGIDPAHQDDILATYSAHLPCTYVTIIQTTNSTLCLSGRTATLLSNNSLVPTKSVQITVKGIDNMGFAASTTGFSSTSGPVTLLANGSSTFYVVSLKADLSGINYSTKIEMTSTPDLSNVTMTRSKTGATVSFLATDNQLNVIQLDSKGSVTSSKYIQTSEPGLKGMFWGNSMDTIYTYSADTLYMVDSSFKEAGTAVGYSMATYDVNFVGGVEQQKMITMASNGTLNSDNSSYGENQPFFVITLSTNGKFSSNSSTGDFLTTSDATAPTTGDLDLKSSDGSDVSHIFSPKPTVSLMTPGDSNIAKPAFTTIGNLMKATVPKATSSVQSMKATVSKSFSSKISAKWFKLSSLDDCSVELLGAPSFLILEGTSLSASEVPNSNSGMYSFTVQVTCYDYWVATAPVSLSLKSEKSNSAEGMKFASGLFALLASLLFF